MEKFQSDPHWSDYILFHEYPATTGRPAFSPDRDGLVATLIQLFGYPNSQKLLEAGKEAAFKKDIGYLV
jgi:hypothetical protein